MSKRGKTGPAANESTLANLRRLHAEQERQDDEDLLAIMQTKCGRRFVYRLIFRRLKLHYGHGGEGHALFRFLGAQDAGRALLARVQALCSDLWILTVQEAAQDELNVAIAKRASAEREAPQELDHDD